MIPFAASEVNANFDRPIFQESTFHDFDSASPVSHLPATSLLPGCRRCFLGCQPRRCRVSQKRDPAGRDGPHICPVVGALGDSRCSTGADDRRISGSSCGGGVTDYFLRGAGSDVTWLSAFPGSICGRLRSCARIPLLIVSTTSKRPIPTRRSSDDDASFVLSDLLWNQHLGGQGVD